MTSFFFSPAFLCISVSSSFKTMWCVELVQGREVSWDVLHTAWMRLSRESKHRTGKLQLAEGRTWCSGELPGDPQKERADILGNRGETDVLMWIRNPLSLLPPHLEAKYLQGCSGQGKAVHINPFNFYSMSCSHFEFPVVKKWSIPVFLDILSFEVFWCSLGSSL